MPQNYDLAAKFYQTAAELKEYSGLNGLGYMHLHGLGRPKSKTKALTFFESNYLTKNLKINRT